MVSFGRALFSALALGGSVYSVFVGLIFFGFDVTPYLWLFMLGFSGFAGALSYALARYVAESARMCF